MGVSILCTVSAGTVRPVLRLIRYDDGGGGGRGGGGGHVDMLVQRRCRLTQVDE